MSEIIENYNTASLFEWDTTDRSRMLNLDDFVVSDDTRNQVESKHLKAKVASEGRPLPNFRNTKIADITLSPFCKIDISILIDTDE